MRPPPSSRPRTSRRSPSIPMRPRRGGLRRRAAPGLHRRHPHLHGDPDLRQLGRAERGGGEVRPGHGAAHHGRHPAPAAHRQGPRHRSRRPDPVRRHDRRGRHRCARRSPARSRRCSACPATRRSSLPTLEPTCPLAFTGFFLLGFLLYATLYAAAGSMVSRIEDVQQAVGPLIFLAMAGYFDLLHRAQRPGRAVGRRRLARPVLQPVPHAGPDAADLAERREVAARARAAGRRPWPLAIWLASRIYSAGVLLYGQRVGIRSVLRATRVAPERLTRRSLVRTAEIEIEARDHGDITHESDRRDRQRGE